jgi:hypothetical protein
MIARVMKAPAEGERRLRLAYDVEIRANGSAASGPRHRAESTVRGPGDVVGFNHRTAISRVDPEPGLRAFETPYFPAVEFVDADLPWRYSLDLGTGPRVSPWIALLALKPREFEFVEQGRAPFPRIRVLSPANSLPDLSQSWACAHVQVDLENAEAGNLTTALASNPAAHFSRLICPRKLDEGETYHLMLVPAYEAGRLVGLGRDNDANPFNAPAWLTTSTDAVELPVYFQSRFTTNALEDVEVLLRRLSGLRDPAAKGAGVPERASTANPGYYAGYAKPGESIERPAAMLLPGTQTEGYGTDPALAALLSTTLAEVIAGELGSPAADGPDREDPLVAMPPYGWRFRNTTAVSETRARADVWFDRINLDLKLRYAAALGAEIVRENQDTFMRKCWEQYEEILAANVQLHQLQFAEALVARLVERRYSLLASDAALELGESLHALVKLSDGKTAADTLRTNGVPMSFTSRRVRQVAAKRPRLDRGDPLKPLFTTAPPIPGDRAGGAQAPNRPAQRAGPDYKASLDVAIRNLLGSDGFSGRARPRSVDVPVREFDSTQIVTALSAMLKRLPGTKALYVVNGRIGPEVARIAPLYRSPVVPLPLANYLEKLDPSHLIPGVSLLPDNTVSIFQENRLFIESLHVGANHDLNNLLRWSEFPTDMRGTVLPRFWDRGHVAEDVNADDIPGIHTWMQPLGKHFPPGARDKEADFIVVIRGDIIRKLGQLVVVVNEAPGTTWQSGQGVNHFPVFFGRIERDIAYYGFDVSRDRLLSRNVRDRVFLLLYEPPGRLRFGLDVANASVRRERRRHQAIKHGFPTATLGRRYATYAGPLSAPGAAPPGEPGTWADFSWSHVNVSTSGYVDFSQSIHMQGQPNHWGASKTSASIARATWQQPVAGILPLARIL